MRSRHPHARPRGSAGRHGGDGCSPAPPPLRAHLLGPQPPPAGAGRREAAGGRAVPAAAANHHRPAVFTGAALGPALKCFPAAAREARPAPPGSRPRRRPRLPADLAARQDSRPHPPASRLFVFPHSCHRALFEDNGMCRGVSSVLLPAPNGCVQLENFPWSRSGPGPFSATLLSKRITQIRFLKTRLLEPGDWFLFQVWSCNENQVSPPFHVAVGGWKGMVFEGRPPPRSDSQPEGNPGVTRGSAETPPPLPQSLVAWQEGLVVFREDLT